MSRPNTQAGQWSDRLPSTGTGHAGDHENSLSAGQNRPAPDAPADGVDNQGGIRRAGLDYQREIGTEQDA
ncbi:hypothetical protein KQH60_11415 [Mycetohabitans sp. B8]|uniref:hypothetical protein n=1 Tax=Mycetohabitans sp. B8 TaxID=2841845 RepID=UPI001F369CEC|nr:hypothetical protein [Mycetohabitans sp. B8]MCG1043109.1 hypothetical protein [Mycetohabitans sp. B8]